MTTFPDAERKRINAVIARFDGWIPSERKCGCGKQHWKKAEWEGDVVEVPDYTSSLDALRPVEMKLDTEQRINYLAALSLELVLPKEPWTIRWIITVVTADAPTRAAALAKVLEQMK